MLKTRWIDEPQASLWHAVAEIVHGRTLLDAQLHAALAPHCEHIACGVAPDDVPQFCAQMVPLVLARPYGPPTQREREHLQRLREAYERHAGTADQLRKQLLTRSGPLREQWEARGPGLMAAVRRLSGGEIDVPQLDVLPVLPVLGGGGEPHPEQASVRIEAVLANPLPQLPEVVRLGWLAARTTLAPGDFLRGSQALVPLLLAAAEHVELARFDQPTLAAALTAWRVEPADEDLPGRLDTWWHAVQAEPLPWRTALAQFV